MLDWASLMPQLWQKKLLGKRRQASPSRTAEERERERDPSKPWGPYGPEGLTRPSDPAKEERGRGPRFRCLCGVVASFHPLQNGWGRDSARARGAPLAHSPNERKKRALALRPPGRVRARGRVLTCPSSVCVEEALALNRIERVGSGPSRCPEDKKKEAWHCHRLKT